MKVGYARVSTKDQTIDLQVDALKKVGCTKIYTEVMSGSRAERPILSRLLENLRAGDVLFIRETRSPWSVAQTSDPCRQRINDAQSWFEEPE
jgi:DNA invertase Pin-like site-specific DNA recombinase